MLGAILSTVVALLNSGIIRSPGGEPTYAARIANRIARNDLTDVVTTSPTDRTSLLFSIKCMQEQLTRTISTIGDVR